MVLALVLGWGFFLIEAWVGALGLGDPGPVGGPGRLGSPLAGGPWPGGPWPGRPLAREGGARKSAKKPPKSGN